MGMYHAARALTDAEAERVSADPESVHQLLVELPDDPGAALDLDTLWDAVRWLLDRVTAADPALALSEAILGGAEVGPDLGYGPARLLAAEQVRRLAAGLEGVSPQTLRAAFDPAQLAAEQVYPQIWDEDADELWAEVDDHLRRLRRFLRQASRRGQPILHAIT